MGNPLSRRQLLAAGGVGVAGLGTFAYLDPLDLASAGKSTSRHTDWLAAALVDDERPWRSLVGFDRSQYEAGRDVFPAETARNLSGEQWLPGEVYAEAIDPETFLIEQRRLRGMAVTGSVDVDQLRSADFPDRRIRVEYPEAEIDVGVEQVGERDGLTLYHKRLSIADSVERHKAIAVDDSHYVQTRFREQSDTALQTVRSLVDAGLAGEGRYRETDDSFDRLLSLLDPGFIVDMSLSRPDVPLGGTLKVDGDVVVHREVLLRREAQSASCADSYEQVIRETMAPRADMPEFQDVSVTADGRALIADVELLATAVSPGHVSPFLANQGAFMGGDC